MPRSWKAGNYWIRWTVVLGLAGAIAPFQILIRLGEPAIAQIVPDGTLGAEQSVITPQSNLRGLPGILIEGGARRGANLFQSFSEFNVGNSQRVYFANPVGVESILSRVTGLNPSHILGTLGVDGSANLFLLNPRGILFGPNARLDVAGSFVASTANKLDFGNGLTFSATNPEAAPMLTVSLRPGLQYGTNYQGDISSAGNLAVGAGQTLALAGKMVSVTGSLVTQGGTVQVLGDRVSLLDNARVNVSGSSGGNVMIGGSFQGNGPLPNAIETYIGPNVTISADGLNRPTPHPAGPTPAPGGRVIIWSDGTTRFDGTISARGGLVSGDGGFVEVSGKQSLIFNGWVDAGARNGKPGTLLLDPTNIQIVAFGGDPGGLEDLLSIPGSSDPKSPGTDVTRINVALINNFPNDVILQATNNITFSAPVSLREGLGLAAIAGNDIFFNSNIGTQGGVVTLDAQRGSVFINGATISTIDPGDIGGDISISAQKQVSLVNSFLTARSNSSDPGFAIIRLVAREGSVSLTNTEVSTTNDNTAGLAGDIFVDARDQISLSANTRLFSRGNFGRILLGVSNSSELNNWQTTNLPASIRITASSLNTENTGDTNRGRISVFATNRIDIEAGSQLTSRSNNNESRDPNEFSRVEIVARNGSVGIDRSLISTTNEGRGFAGDVVISARNEISINDSNSQTDGGIFSRGNQGRVLLGRSNSFVASYPDFSPSTIQISNSVININNSSVEGSADATINSLRVSVRAANLIAITNESEISSSTERRGNAGTVTVEAPNRITLDDSRIFSNVEEGGIGDAGRVSVSTDSLFVLNGGQIQTLVRGPGDDGPAGRGDAGEVFIDAPKTVRVIGRNAGGFPSAIFSRIEAGAEGTGGNVGIETRSLHVRNGGRIGTDNFGTGAAGDVFISALGVWVDDRASISSSSQNGQGGNILLNVPGAIILGRNGQVLTSAKQASALLGERAGNIAIGTGNLLDAPTAFGDLAFRFDRPILLLAGKTVRDNNISSEGFLSNGGFIRVNAFRLQDIARRNDSPFTNDITAESIFGVSGEVVVSAFNIFPSFRVDPLPERYTPPRVSEGCDPRVRQETSRFVVTGRGGLPSDPTEVLNPGAIATPSSSASVSATPVPPASPTSNLIKPAQGWVRDANGNVRLVADASNSASGNSYPFWSVPTSCYAP
ncbi:MAG: filamentous hemagglutinin N-terminal domain-containing protein [Leptolyngbyaceae cyanobacterium HOT.MB2.61]|nr:filamentous hemagglutinin N-terminal domain-containing protein [Leptolyngbyaceae cyanobacterium HOT.MB2.61]